MGEEGGWGGEGEERRGERGGLQSLRGSFSPPVSGCQSASHPRCASLGGAGLELVSVRAPMAVTPGKFRSSKPDAFAGKPPNTVLFGRAAAAGTLTACATFCATFCGIGGLG